MWALENLYTRQLSGRWGISRSLLFRINWLLVNWTRKNLSRLWYRGHHNCYQLTKWQVYQHHWNGVTLHIELRVPYSLLWLRHDRCRWDFLGLMSSKADLLFNTPPPQKNSFVICYLMVFSFSFFPMQKTWTYLYLQFTILLWYIN